MALTIRSALADYSAQRMLSESRSRIDAQLNKSESRTKSSSGTDSKTDLSLTRSTTNIAARNINDGLSAVQTARDGLSSIDDKVSRLKDLATQASSSNVTSEDRAKIVKEATTLQNDIKDTVKNTKYGNDSVLRSSGSTSYQTGRNAAEKVTVVKSDAGKSIENSGLYSADLSSAESAAKASKAFQAAQESVQGIDKRYASAEKSLQSAARSLGANKDNSNQDRAEEVRQMAERFRTGARDALDALSNTSPRGVAELLL